MTHTYFNRHENMDGDILKKINKLILELFNVTGETGHIGNMLFGLFDGFLYADLVPEAKKVLPTEMYLKIKCIVIEIEGYPKTEIDTTEH